ncbi:cell wall binding repeat 2 family protein [Clostridium argentinense CDC 2741]|uniref:Cell wall binding repeat 2 family protein n=1 Tax=Clostridium argentinense CDC 2741 TaxID=1418104 RepID=A0A0C1U0Z4_9CLOT|nr:cell wall-binding repeat-containing protein [Clostridium argentinense]ARC86595.1 hypothetical protein RSJ17_19930 [Clostridium argentinense]KIE46574.1 cell wall binding repeat 2 family protein [Clostridium argentinense CDC 2741]NFF38062.1 hypothetical protein [Clostridium argentinense]NFP50044.1 hypothetical protein [Clostridium argentinense]NFP74518.1 hypothetical protein [Clostridium argentinense]
MVSSGKVKVLVALTIGTLISSTLLNGVSVYANNIEGKATSVITNRLPADNKGDRYDTAIAISKNGWANGSNTIVLVTGADYPDALSATPLAKKYDAPILLTKTNEIPANVLEEIKRLKANKIIIVGGNGVITDEVEKELKSVVKNVERVKGDDRYDTAVNVAKILGVENGVAVAYGLNYSDALSIAPLAAGLSMPILLTKTNEMDEKVQGLIKDKNIPVSYIIGGEGVISNTVMNKFKNPKRISGINRYETNVEVLKYFSSKLNYDKTYVATGMNYPDALAGSTLAARTNSPLILTNNSVIEKPTLEHAKLQMSKEIYALGGSSIVGDNVLQQLKTDMGYGNISHIDTQTVEAKHKSTFELPKTVVATLEDGRKKEVAVKWTNSIVDTSAVGVKSYEGLVMDKTVVLNVKVVPYLEKVSDLTDVIGRGDKYTFPTMVKGTMSDGTSKDFKVNWDNTYINSNTLGNYNFTGIVEGENKQVKLTVTVKEVFKVIDIR